MLELALEGGGTAEVDESDGEHVVLLATRSSPPGSTLTGRAGDDGRFLVKVRGCRRVADQEPTRYRIEGRWVNLSRAQRARVMEAGKG